MVTRSRKSVSARAQSNERDRIRQSRASRIALVTVATFSGLGVAVPGHAQFPSKSLRLVVPYAPGGVVDFVGRTLAQRLSEQLGQSVVIDNRGGAGGILGTEVASRAGADGYTLLLMDPAIVINQSLQPKVPYDVLKDFATVTIATSSPLVLAINTKVAAKTVQDLVAVAKAKPGALTFASAGIGTTPHMAGEFFKARIGQALVHVPYKGSGPAMQDLVGGNVQMTFSSIAAAIPFIREGRLVALATTGAKRVSALPEVPTMIEAGFAGFEVELWQAVFVPGGTPRDTIVRLHAETTKALQSTEVRAALAKVGNEAVGNASVEASAFVRAELAKWARLVKDAGIRSE
ncbi:MAG: tripartite tricarboxylate transporter substrate binding protein [Proteobacteria bacterium]|nr:tripartite tricarboxylate transporter substrate binding protein [Burkholderiales bacterium]